MFTKPTQLQSDDYENSDTGVRFHAFRVFTLLNDTQYQIVFGLPENNRSSVVDPVGVVLTSFHFQIPAATEQANLTIWTDPKGLVQLQYPSGWIVSIEAGNENSVLELLGPDDTYFYVSIYEPQTRTTLQEEVQETLDGDADNLKFMIVPGHVTDTTVGGEPSLTYPFTYTARNKANAQTYNGRRWESQPRREGIPADWRC